MPLILQTAQENKTSTSVKARRRLKLTSLMQLAIKELIVTLPKGKARAASHRMLRNSPGKEREGLAGSGSTGTDLDIGGRFFDVTTATPFGYKNHFAKSWKESPCPLPLHFLKRSRGGILIPKRLVVSNKALPGRPPSKAADTGRPRGDAVDWASGGQAPGDGP